MSGSPGCSSALLCALCSACAKRCGVVQDESGETELRDGVHHQSRYKQEGCLSNLFLFLICILLPSGALSFLSAASCFGLTRSRLKMRERTALLTGRCLTVLCRTKGEIQLLYIEDAEIFRAFSVQALTFDSHPYAYDFVLLPVVWVHFRGGVAESSFLYPAKLMALNLGPWLGRNPCRGKCPWLTCRWGRCSPVCSVLYFGFPCWTVRSGSFPFHAASTSLRAACRG